MVDMVSNSADANACLFQEGKKVGVDDIEGAIRLTLLDDARNVDLAGTCIVLSARS